MSGSPPSVTSGDTSPQGWRFSANLHPWEELSAQLIEGGNK